MVNHVVRQPFGQVVAGGGDEKAGPSLAQVHFKELVFAVPGVQLHVEVGEAHIADALQEILHLLGQGVVPGVDDGGVAADALRGMLLQQGLAQGDELYLFVGAAVAVHHPHLGVVAGDVFLQNQVVFIGRTVNGIEDSGKFLLVLGHEHLFLVGEFAVPVGHRVGGLDNYREIKGQLHGFVVFIGTGRGFGEGEAVLGADLVKALFDGQPHEQLLADAFKAVVGAELVLVADQELDVIVAAGDQE